MYETSSSEDDDDEHPNYRKARTFRSRFNFEVSDPFVFKEKFRVHRDTFEHIIEKIGPSIAHPTKRNHALDPAQQLKVALHWMGNGAQYHGVGDMHGVDKSTVHRCVYRVSKAINEQLYGEEVRWPDDCSHIASEFFRFAGFPRVGGCADGSLIPIDAPTENELSFVDRNGDHSINILVVCGPRMEFFYANAMWPGSVHDARVLRNSSLETRWTEGWRPFQNAVLLGDSGYPLKEWLLTPVWNGPQTEGVTRYLRKHKSTRAIVERSIGCLKEKFPCLNHLRLNPSFAAQVILACIAVYNIENRFHAPNRGLFESNDNDTMESEEEIHGEVPASARAVLQEFVSAFEI